MSKNIVALDVDYEKSQFPAFKDPKSSKWFFFENAGGSYVPINVIDHLNHLSRNTNYRLGFSKKIIIKKIGNKIFILT